MINKFWPIVDNWHHYYENPHEGMGTTYERLLLHGFFNKVAKKYSINSVLEVPAFGMTGVSDINSAWWYYEKQIIPVVLDNHAERIKKTKMFIKACGLQIDLQFVENFNKLDYKSNEFDFSWNFAGLVLIDEPEILIEEMLRVTSKVIFISIPNVRNIGFLLRKFLFYSDYKKVMQDKLITIKRISQIIKNAGWKVVDSGYFDCPPWPDFPVQKEKLLPFLKKTDRSDDRDSDGEIQFFLDIWNKNRDDLLMIEQKFNFLENVPLLNLIWSHHSFIIGEKC